MTLAESDGSIRIRAGSDLDLGTFFNAFSRAKWHGLTGIGQVAVRLCGVGQVEVRVLGLSATTAAVTVLQTRLHLSGSAVDVTIGDLADLPGEVLAVELTAHQSDVVIRSACWTTACIPLRDVALAAVIVTFDREPAVMRAIERFSSATIPHAPFPLHLFVIDNGRTLQAGAGEHVTIVPNPNLGGSGGFARGLIASRAAGTFTHALFMDDDAACEPESVWRCQALLAHARDPRAGVAGAMLLTDQPGEQHEKGARFDLEDGRFCESLGQGAQLMSLSDVVRNENLGSAAYGGWWFFAFPLSAVTHMPFPFFVRGDDIDFSLVNELPIMTLNGVASWCDAFGGKISARTEYLNYRAWLAMTLMRGSRRAVRRTLLRVLQHALTFGFRFDYACMEAITGAIEDVTRGPEVFGEDPAPTARLRALSARPRGETLSPEAFGRLDPLSTAPRLSRMALGFVSLGGYLLPRSGKPARIPHVRVPYEAGRFALVRADEVAVGIGQRTRIFRRDRAAMAGATRRLLASLWKLWRALPVVQDRYRQGASQYRTEAYWERQLGLGTHGSTQVGASEPGHPVR